MPKVKYIKKVNFKQTRNSKKSNISSEHHVSYSKKSSFSGLGLVSSSIVNTEKNKVLLYESFIRI